ncbi:MAG TPA: hypothetical protein VKW76_05030 [Candidatus Binatia bacterium]|nr:hypothetical protein [Candidatus Binatia bacterium]
MGGVGGERGPVWPAAFALVLLAGTGCAARANARAVVPDATFVARRTHDGLTIDRMTDGGPAVVESPGWLRLPGEPTFVLHDPAGEQAGLWVVEPGRVVVRRGRSEDAPVIGRVVPSWEDDAIRLRIEPADAPAVVTDVFARTDRGAGPAALSRIARSSAGVRGTYRATLRREDGTSVGWLEVRVGLHQAAFVTYDGALPPTIDEPLAAAAAVALGSEIDWIEEHVTGVSRPPEWRP